MGVIGRGPRLKPIIGKYSSVVQFCKVPEVIANFKEGEAPACLTEGKGRS